ncbi:helix-turn-helix domain-containing protein [Planifilum fimeticola]
MIQKLREYQTFAIAEEMMKAVEQHIKTTHMTKSAFKVLRLIAWHAKNHPGAAWLKAKTIAESCKISIPTVRRATRLLVDLGIIRKVHTTRKLTGGDGANIYIILPLDTPNDSPQMIVRQSEETPCHNENEEEISQAEYVTSECLSKEIPVMDVIDEREIDRKIVPKIVPEDFQKIALRYFNSVQVYGLWLRVVKAMKLYTALPWHNSDVVDMAIESLLQTVTAHKAGRIRKGTDFDAFCAYFFGILSQVFAAYTRKQTAKYAC